MEDNFKIIIPTKLNSKTPFIKSNKSIGSIPFFEISKIEISYLSHLLAKLVLPLWNYNLISQALNVLDG